MKSEPTIVYRDVAIKHYNNQYRLDGEGYADKLHPTLTAACEAIDKLQSVSFKPVAVFFDDSYTSPGIATSVTDDGHVWIYHPEKKGKYGAREKVRGPGFLDTPENRALYTQIDDVRKELDTVVDGFEDKIKAVKNKMAQIGGKRREK